MVGILCVKLYKQNIFVVGTVLADVLAPVGARTSAGTVMTKIQSHIYVN